MIAKIIIRAGEYSALREAQEDLADLRAYDEGKAALAAGTDEQVPADIAKRLIFGENALAVWREYRGMTHAQLTVATGIGRSHLVQIERGHRVGSAATLTKLAIVLGIDLDDLV